MCCPQGSTPDKLRVMNSLKTHNGFEVAACFAAARKLILIGVCAVALPACAFRDSDNDRAAGPQTFPANYRVELLAFMRSYLNDPRGIREAVIAEPVQRTVGGRLRYVTCLRYAPREAGGYSPAKERAVLYVDGRLDRLIEDGAEVCAGSTYAPFLDLEKLTR